MRPESLKSMVRSERAKVGTLVVEFCTPGIGHILKSAGCDFALFDMEHSGFGVDTLKQALRYMEAANLPTIVRVPSHRSHHIARALDMGAEGIMVPMVGSDAEARAIVSHAKYPPLGQRGVALRVAHDRYAPGPASPKLVAANRRTTIFAQIETREGVESAERIAAVEDVDCLWIGHFDLSVSLGIPGRFEHPEFKAAVASVRRACATHGKSLGRLVPDARTGIAMNKAGFDFLCYSADAWVLRATMSDGIAALRKVCTVRRGAG